MFLKKMRTHFNGYHAILIKISSKNDQQLLTVKPILFVLNGERFLNFLIYGIYNSRNPESQCSQRVMVY